MTNRPLAVAHVIDTLTWGGAQKLLVTFAQAARSYECTTTVITLRPRDDAPFYGELEALGVRVVAFPCRRLFAPRQISRLVQFLRRERFDVIHSHLNHANIIGPFAGWLTHTPVVASLHNTQARKRRFHAMRETIEGFALRHGARRVIAVGHVVADAQRERLRGKRLDTILNAVEAIPALPDHERTALRTELVGDPARTLLISVGRLAPQKGYRDLLTAFAAVHQQHPEAALLIAGGGELHDELAGQIRELGLQTHARLLGPRTDVPRLLAASDIYVSAAHWEGLPVAVLEAMAAHLPIVATAVGDVPYVVTDAAGVTVPPHEPAALAAAMHELLADPQRRQQMGQAAQAHVARDYNPALWLEQLMTLYGEVCQRTPVVSQMV